MSENPVENGQCVPDFPFEATSGLQGRIADFRGRQVVLYFYPKDHTPGCTTESQDFAARYPDFQACNTEIIGISRDSLRTHENFRRKHELPFELISDSSEEICQRFDVLKPKKLYGKSFIGIERSTFLIDESGVLRESWRKVKVPEHVEAVLKAAQELQQSQKD